MPEFNKRVVVEGMPEAEEGFSEYIAERLQVEKGAKSMTRELKELQRQAAELRRRAERSR